MSGSSGRGELKIADVIGVAEKRRLPAIATLGDMMRRIRRNDPAYARFPAAMYTFCLLYKWPNWCVARFQYG